MVCSQHKQEKWIKIEKIPDKNSNKLVNRYEEETTEAVKMAILTWIYAQYHMQTEK